VVEHLVLGVGGFVERGLVANPAIQVQVADIVGGTTSGSRARFRCASKYVFMRMRYSQARALVPS
jgi:hypothetical protein